MNERFREVFFQVYESLPRQGPGDLDSAKRALALCRHLPRSPMILDMGCGVGGQTLHLADLTPGTIFALDNHAPSVRRLARSVTARGLGHIVRPVVGDMADPPFPPASFDLIWSEGALYQIGMERALGVCHGLLGPGGHMAFTDAVWRKADPPAEIRESFDLDYPAMATAPAIVSLLGHCGFELLGRFTLPDQAWWQDFYYPMEERIRQLRPRYLQDAQALAAFDLMAREPELHRRYSDYYAYEFFVAKKRTKTPQGTG